MAERLIAAIDVKQDAPSDIVNSPSPSLIHRLVVLVQTVASETCNFPLRIAAILAIRWNNPSRGYPIAMYPEDQRKLSDDERSKFLSAYTVCMEALMREHRFFGVFDLRICNQAFHEGAKWSGRNFDSEERNKFPDP